jgi:ABC-type amino acid transport substrate-binding protein
MNFLPLTWTLLGLSAHKLRANLVFLVCVFALFNAMISSVSATEVARYPERRNPMPDAMNYVYSLDMLNLALEKSKSSVVSQLVPGKVSDERKIAGLIETDTYDVYWSSSSEKLERDLIPIRICLFKGLNGWRIPVVSKENRDIFAKVKNVSDLRRLSAGQGAAWIDSDVLIGSGIYTEHGPTTESLYKMLEAKRFDFLPRGVQEVMSEMSVRQHMDIVMDTHVLIRYPSAFYFFVRKDKPELAKTIKRGLEAALKDGSFNELFYKYYGTVLQRAQLDKRKIIDLPNPQVSLTLPQKQSAMWFTLKDLKSIPKQPLLP